MILNVFIIYIYSHTRESAFYLYMGMLFEFSFTYHTPDKREQDSLSITLKK